MPVPVLYPKVSLEETTGRISRWLVAEGDRVSAGQVLFEIENDKAAVEVEAPAAGILRGLAAEGRMVDVGAPVAQIHGEGDAAAPAPASAAPASAPAVASVPAPAAAPAPAAMAAASPRARGPNPTPLARRIAREQGISLEGIVGTGPRGRVQRKDVLARLAAPIAAGAGADLLHRAWLRRGEGRPLVLLHGFSADLNNWRGMLAGAALPWPVLALDLPAHGASPRAVPRDLDAVAAEVEAALEAEGLADCALVGHSFGAAVAARLAARGRVDVRALGLIAPAGLDAEVNHAFTAGILRATRAETLRPWLELLVAEPRVISDAFLRAVEAARRDTGLTAAMAAFADRFLAEGTQTFSIRADLAGLRMPVRVIFGRQDRILPFRSSRGLPGHVGLHAFDGCGHMPHLERPEAVLALIGELTRSAG